MRTSQVVAKNTLLLSAGLFSGRILALFVTRKMTPILGPTGMGIWGLATDLSAILLVVANFGLNTLITREVTRARGMTGAILWAALRLRLLIGLACFLVLLLYLDLSDYDGLTRAAVLITGLGIFIEASAMACDAVLQAHERVEYQAAGQMLSAVVYFGLAWWWLEAGHGVMGVVWANLISRVVRLAIMAPLMFWKTGPWRWRDPGAVTQPSVLWLMRLGLPLFFATTFGIVSYKLDTVMLSNMKGAAVTGVYVLGHRALDYLLYVPGIFATAVFPALARYAAAGGGDATRLGERSLRLVLGFSLPLTLLVAATAPAIIGWFDPSPRFADAVPILRIVVWGMAFQSANLILNRLLMIAERERTFIAIGLTALIVNVSLNSVLIPRFSYFGASVATICSLAASTVLHLYFVWPTAYRPRVGRTIVRPVVGLAVTWAAAYVLERLFLPGLATPWVLPLNAGWGGFLAAAVGSSILYAASLLGLGVVTRADLRVLRDALRSSPHPGP
ncbi:MAG: flippase [Candidatus Krumholzibacteriia bacterium]